MNFYGENLNLYRLTSAVVLSKIGMTDGENHERSETLFLFCNYYEEGQRWVKVKLINFDAVMLEMERTERGCFQNCMTTRDKAG